MHFKMAYFVVLFAVAGFVPWYNLDMPKRFDFDLNEPFGIT
jgi:hypothetical protein